MKRQISLEINELISQFRVLSYKELADLIESKFRIRMKLGTIRQRYRRIVGKKATPEARERTIDEDRTLLNLRKRKSVTDKKYKLLLETIDDQDKIIEAQKALKESSYFKIEPKKTNGESHATAVIVLSDWHSEELVDKIIVNGLNEFNLDIAKKRSIQCFQTALRMLNIFKRDIQIDRVILALLGDFFSGSIHDDLMESNLLSPIDATMFAQELLLSGINFLLKETDFDFVIPCHSGNHGRMTKKNRHSTEAGNSLERFMYHSLSTHFIANKRVEFIIAPSYHSYVQVYPNYTIRFSHGHNVRYAGGVGGITIPVNKAIAQWNKARNVDLDVFG